MTNLIRAARSIHWLTRLLFLPLVWLALWEQVLADLSHSTEEEGQI